MTTTNSVRKVSAEEFEQALDRESAIDLLLPNLSADIHAALARGQFKVFTRIDTAGLDAQAIPAAIVENIQTDKNEEEHKRKVLGYYGAIKEKLDVNTIRRLERMDEYREASKTRDVFKLLELISKVGKRALLDSRDSLIIQREKLSQTKQGSVSTSDFVAMWETERRKCSVLYTEENRTSLDKQDCEFFIRALNREKNSYFMTRYENDRVEFREANLPDRYTDFRKLTSYVLDGTKVGQHGKPGQGKSRTSRIQCEEGQRRKPTLQAPKA